MKAKIFKTIALLLLGIILGSSFTNIYIGMQLDYLTLANRTLQDKLADSEKQLQSLKDTADNKKKNTITGIEIFLLLDSIEGLTDYDRLTAEYEANKKVKEWLNPLIGQDLAEIDALLIPRIIDSREIEANGNTYRLRTFLVVINKKTEVYIKCTKIKADGKM